MSITYIDENIKNKINSYTSYYFIKTFRIKSDSDIIIHKGTRIKEIAIAKIYTNRNPIELDLHIRLYDEDLNEISIHCTETEFDEYFAPDIIMQDMKEQYKNIKNTTYSRVEVKYIVNTILYYFYFGISLIIFALLICSVALEKISVGIFFGLLIVLGILTIIEILRRSIFEMIMSDKDTFLMSFNNFIKNDEYREINETIKKLEKTDYK